ncbi:hypothetical protein [Dyadobacter sp. CY356]|uniref:hypothetical protein n=1 Tax=Dyadobacter sp. CY356 TaxID=2906442 RepID=UPI001F2DDDA6|nr:hypothetical protein [Dyadobacter sp. CY356]MCF0054488.1 hypothetical protein [Dyadobacter sp. CY356]
MKNLYTACFQIGIRPKSINHLAALLMLKLISLQAQVGVGKTTPDGTTSKLASGAVTLNKLAAADTADRTTYLRGDNTSAKPQELISTSVFGGFAGNSFPSSNSYVFARPKTTITLTSSKQITASAVVGLGFLGSNRLTDNNIHIDISFQLVSGTITGLNGGNYIAHRLVNEKRTYSATVSPMLPAGTYQIGLAIRNTSNYNISNNDYVNGWVMVY